MKKQLLSLFLSCAGLSLLAQTPRMSLLEEFTGETCPPCAATNPAFDAMLMTPAAQALVIPIKWQVPIPSTPSPTWSLYKTNMTEINWRLNTYPYGVNSAPECRLDGKPLTAFGSQAPNANHAAKVNVPMLTTSSSYTTPFSIGLTRAWSDNTYSAVTLTVNIAASASFSANTDNLRCRVVMIEKEIHFATQPGTNGEKDFHWAVRKSFPDIQNGTLLAQSWTNAQTQTFTLNCVLPAYIVDKAQVAFVAFIQDDSDMQIWQAAQTTTAAVANDAKVSVTAMPPMLCSATVVPQTTVINYGDNTITAFTVVPTFDGVAGTPVNWTGNLAVGASTVVSFGTRTIIAGSHTYSYNVSNVSGGDMSISNNKGSTSFVSVIDYQADPVVEGFTVTTFPPANWSLYNANSADKWVRNGFVGAQGSSESAKVDFFNIASGTIMDLILPPVNVEGTQPPFMTFDVAYAQYNSSFNDRLQVLVSTDCGANWTIVFDKAGANLKTVNPQTSAFTPSSEDHWRNESVELVGYEAATSLLVKFKATSNFGNNLYLDNVNLQQWAPFEPVGVKGQTNILSSVSVFPNPSNGETTVKVNASSASSGKISVVNVLGQEVYSKNISLELGSNVIKFDATEFAGGIYNVIIDTNKGKTVKKLTVN